MFSVILRFIVLVGIYSLFEDFITFIISFLRSYLERNLLNIKVEGNYVCERFFYLFYTYIIIKVWGYFINISKRWDLSWFWCWVFGYIYEKIFMAFAITLSFGSLLLKYAFTVLQKVLLSFTFLKLKFSWCSFFVFRKRFTQ